MASFNPQTQDTGVTDNLHFSRGGQANKSFENLFSGIGDAVQQGVQTADNFVQNKIGDEVKAGTEKINQDFGLDPSQTPAELLQSQAGLQKLATAQIQGKVTPEYYYQQLAAQTKLLRTKYPGYDDQIDQIVQKVTGLNPANSYRAALLQNINQANEQALSSQNKFESWARENAGYIQNTNPDFFTNPAKYSTAEGQQQLYGDVAKMKGQEEAWKYQKGQMENNKDFAMQATSERLNQITTSAIAAPTKTLGMSGQDFYTKLNQLSKNGGGTPDEIAALNNQFTQFRANAQAQMFNALADVNILSPVEKQQQIQAALAPLDAIQQAINDKNYSQAATIAARTQMNENKALSYMYKQAPQLAGVAALGRINPQLAQDAAQAVVGKSGTSVDFFTQTGITDITSDIIGGKDTLADATNRVANNVYDTPAGKAAKVNGLIDTSLEAIKSGKASPDEFSGLTKGVYGQNGKDAFTMVPANQYLPLFNKMFNPEVTKAFVKNGDPDALKQYTDAAVSKFQAIPEFRQAAADLSDNVDFEKYLHAHYDEKTNRIVLEADKEAIGSQGYFSRSDSRLHLDRAAKAADSLNQALSVMAPIIEANGGDEGHGVQQLIRDMGLNLNADKKSGFFNWLNDQLDNSPSVSDKADVTKTSGADQNGKNTPVATIPLPSIDNVLQGNVGGFRDGVRDFERSQGQPTEGVQEVTKQKPDEIPDWEFTLENSTPDKRTVNSASPGGAWLQYANQGATRDQKLAPKLVDSMSFLKDQGITMQVFSGGQDAEGPDRTGSHRHDHGNAADVFFYKDGRRLNWADPDDRPIFENIVREAKARGVTGFGAGPGYMRPGSMHLGFGTPAVWGAGGESANAPEWLRMAYGQ